MIYRDTDIWCNQGISLTIEQFSNFVTVLPEIEAALKEKGVEVTRPVYDGAGREENAEVEEEGGEQDAEDEQEEDAGKEEKGGGKKNFEETSEEGE